MNRKWKNIKNVNRGKSIVWQKHVGSAPKNTISFISLTTRLENEWRVRSLFSVRNASFWRHMLTVFLGVIYRNPCEKQSEFSYSRVNFNNLNSPLL